MYRQCLFLFLFVPLFSFSATGGLSGVVVDAETGEPLPYTNVFFTNTTFGDAADDAGRFVLEKIPPGAYQIVVSRIGYELFVQDISIQPGIFKKINVSLRVKSLSGAEISVTAQKNPDWKNDLQLFRTYFLGRTRNAQKCTILNPHVLSFKKSTSAGDLIASAEQPLIIENRALGYRIEMVLGYFRYGFSGGRYLVYPKYTELETTSTRIRKKRNKARQQAFFDSQRGFFFALSRKKKQEDYYVALRKQADNYLPLYSLTLDPAIIDSALTIRRLEQPVRLHVKYMSDEASDLFLKYGYVDFDANGNIYPADAITVSGYWVKNRIADTLPFDYAPSN